MDKSLMELIELLKNYLTQQTPSNFLDKLINLSPLVTVIVLIISAIAGLKKYYYEKDKERNEKILSNVYTPFMHYLVLQEVYRHIFMPNTNYNETPILEVTSRKFRTIQSEGNTSHKITIDDVCGLTRKNIIELKKKVDFGLAPQNLLALMNMYEMLVDTEEKWDGVDTRKEYLQSSILKVKVERALRKEIFTGYIKYHNKLDIKNNANSELWKFQDDNIVFEDNISDDDIQKFKSAIEANSEKYRRSKASI